jgi:hypothetical protein
MTPTAQLLGAPSQGSYTTDTVTSSVAFAITPGRVHTALGADTISVRT